MGLSDLIVESDSILAFSSCFPYIKARLIWRRDTSQVGSILVPTRERTCDFE